MSGEPPPSKRDLLARLMRERAERAAARRTASAPARIARTPAMELSFGQERIWTLDQLRPSSQNNILMRFGLRGRLDRAALTRSVDALLKRHEILRTRFPAIDGKPAQEIDPPPQVQIPLLDLSDLPPGVRAGAARRATTDQAARFDLACGPLLRALLIRLAEHDHILVIAVHHIASDGWSVDLMCQDVAAFYAHFAGGAELSLTEPGLQYVDFAYWQRALLERGALDQSRDYWRKQLRGPLPSTELPFDRKPSADRSFEGAVHRFTLDMGLQSALRELSRSEGVTLYTTLLAALNALLMRYTGEEDLVVGTVVAGRSRIEVERLVGFFANTLVLRTDLSGNPPFRDALARTREVVLQAQAHADFPFDALVKELQPHRDLARSPFFDIVFNMQSFDFDAGFDVAGLRINSLSSIEYFSVTDTLSIFAYDIRNQLDIVLVYNPELFDASTMAGMERHLTALLGGIVADPGKRLSDLPLMSPGERQTVIAFGRGPRLAAPLGAHRTNMKGNDPMNGVHELLERLQSRDIRLTLEGERLNVSAPKGALTPELRDELTRLKEEVKTALRGLAAASEHRSGGIPRIARAATMPISHTQQRLWFLMQMDPGNAAYNIPSALWMRGNVDGEALETVLAQLVARHESLRTRFVERDGAPVCIIDGAAVLKLARINLKHVPVQQHDQEARRFVVEFASRPFDLTTAPLMRAALISFAADVHVFCFVLHHIIADGLSLSVLAADFHALYLGHLSQQPAALPELPVQYVDYAEWERRSLSGGALQQQREFWKNELGGSLPVLQLPMDRPRPPLQTFAGARVFALFPKELSDRLKTLARSEGVTLFMVLLAGLQVLLQRYTGEEDLPVGTAVANRNRPEVDRVVGFFANNIVLRGNLGGGPTVRELLGRTREIALNAFANQDIPFDMLVNELATRRDLEHSPLFQILFVLNNFTGRKVTLPGVEWEPLMFESGTSRFDLAVDAIDLNEGLTVFFEYNTDLFDAPAMERMLNHYRSTLEALAANPAARIADLQLLEPAERIQLTIGWNATMQAYDRSDTVHGLIDRQAANNPTGEAVRDGARSLTYAELQERSNRLARFLASAGVKRETLVGLCVERSVDMVVAQLAILKAGGAYVPIDPAFPTDRIAHMANDAGLALVVTQESLAHIVPGEQIRRVRIDSDAALIGACSPEQLPATSDGSNLAYVIYTSGSTGKPKGVQLEHHSVVNFLLSMHLQPGIGARDKLLAVTTLSFDIAGLEIFGPLTAGGTVIIADRATAHDGYALADLIRSSGASILQATPATWRVLLECGWAGSPGLKMLCGGEALPRDLADELLGLPGELWNMYGPTETTIWSTVDRVKPSVDLPGIGKPIANTQVYVLDANRQPVPIGVPGELYIAGDGVARGYLNRPDLTAERFVPDPFAQSSDARMYRTGDLARWRGDGSLQCLGRADQQVKVRGYRIEPGEIEVVLGRHPGVAQAVVVARPDSSGANRLIAYAVGRDGQVLEPAELRPFLSRDLPEYMIPSIFVQMDSLPLTPNGKIDRKALPDPASHGIAKSSAYVQPANDTEGTIAAIWQKILKVDRVGREDNFFDLGGHSLLVVQVQNRILKDLGRSVPIVDFFQHTTVAALAARLESASVTPDRVSGAHDRAARRRAALGSGAAS